MRYYTNNDFLFENLYLSNPYELQWGKSYLSKIRINNDDDVLIQFPKCKTKNGFCKNNTHNYIDLLFNNYDEKLKEWVNNIKNKIIQLIYEKNNEWFSNDVSLEDINNNFIDFIKKYKNNLLLKV